MQSSGDLHAPALELGTLKPEFLGRNLVQTSKKEQTTLMYLHREILILPSFVLFCRISKQVEKLYFSNCCCVCYVFSQLSVVVSSWHFNCLKWYTVKIFRFPRAKWTFARPDYSVELGNWYLVNRVNLSQYLLSKLRKKKILKVFLKSSPLQHSA